MYKQPFVLTREQQWTEQMFVHSGVLKQFRQNIKDPDGFGHRLPWTRDNRIWGDACNRAGKQLIRVSFYVTSDQQEQWKPVIDEVANDFHTTVLLALPQVGIVVNPAAHKCYPVLGSNKPACWKVAMFVENPFYEVNK